MKNILWMMVSLVITIIMIPMLLIQSCEFSEPEIEEKEIIESDKTVNVYISDTKKIVTLDLEEYVKGVIAGEMPASFEMEALKAQAVAARSYAVSRINKYKDGGQSNHPGAELCDTVHCQVWLSKEKLREVKSKYWMRDYWPRIEKAVEDTRGLIMTYQGSPIDQPLFHSTSGGKTENSEDVFVAWVPYLRSVESPFEEKAPYLSDTTEVSIDTFVTKFRKKYSDSNITKSNISSELKIVEKSEGGRVLKLQVGNKTVTGREIRELLGLRSANFQVKITGGKLVFTTFGYGHGVGMSQWGANGMAERGYKFDEILKHYYVGVEVERLK
ncbi:MAG: stage II sporulation protein D [Bacillota bacterium]